MVFKAKRNLNRDIFMQKFQKFGIFVDDKMLSCSVQLCPVMLLLDSVFDFSFQKFSTSK